jgi:chitin synthase
VTQYANSETVESIMNEEDRKKYALAQAGQRAAGGAYMTEPPTGQVYELSEAELAKSGWGDSAESVVTYQSRPAHSRGTSYNSIGGDVTPPETGDANSLLTVPPTSSNGQNRRSGRSPLARVSLIRTNSHNGDDHELEDQRRQSRSPQPRRSK